MTIEFKNIDANDFADAFLSMADAEERTGCTWFDLCTDFHRNRWAVVLGWGEEGNLRAKVAYQTGNSAMQCDYDVDWLMPFDENDGEVWNTDVAIEDAEDARSTLPWLVAEAKDMAESGVLRLPEER